MSNEERRHTGVWQTMKDAIPNIADSKKIKIHLFASEAAVSQKKGYTHFLQACYSKKIASSFFIELPCMEDKLNSSVKVKESTRLRTISRRSGTEQVPQKEIHGSNLEWANKNGWVGKQGLSINCVSFFWSAFTNFNFETPRGTRQSRSWSMVHHMRT